MFEMKNQTAKIAHVNLREEKHGEEDVLACDLKVEAKMANDFLAQLSPALQASLYERGDGLDLGDAHVTKLRFPLLQTPLKWEGKIVGAKVTLHAPVSGDDLVIFADVGELRLSPQDGGTVHVGFRVQFRPDGDQAAQTPFLLGKSVEISVTKPVADPDLADTGGGAGGGESTEEHGDAGGDDTAGK